MTTTGPEMERQSFVSRFGGVYEHSPWIAEAVYERLGGHAPSGPVELHREFESVIRAAGRVRQLGLLRAHPDLACGRAAQAQMTAASRAEQTAAGLDHCSPAEFEEFARLNREYRDRFGFPFIIAVRGRHRVEILAEFRRRIRNDPAMEFREALRQVGKIGALRIAAIFND